MIARDVTQKWFISSIVFFPAALIYVGAKRTRGERYWNLPILQSRFCGFCRVNGGALTMDNWERCLPTIKEDV
jgi:hypothetical protein